MALFSQQDHAPVEEPTRGRPPRRPRPDAGQPLPTAIRADMETRFGHDFSQVRLHADEASAWRAERLSAAAFTEGEHVYFGGSRLRPETPDGRHLLAHELTHVVQQRGQRRQPGAARVADRAAEHEADALATQVVSGAASGRAAPRRRPAVVRQHAGVQCQDKDPPAGGQPPAKPATAADPLTGGLKVVADELAKNEQVKAKLIEPLKKTAKAKFDLIDPTDKKVLIGWAAATYGLTVGSLLSDPRGRVLLSDVNLAAPLTLIPDSYLTEVRYTLPSEKADQRQLFRLKLGFDIPLRLTFFQGKLPMLVDSRLSFDVTGAYDVDASSTTLSAAQLKLKIGEVEIKGGYDLGLDPRVRPNLNASVGLGKAVTISGGRYPDLLAPTPIGYPDPDGHLVTSKKSIPDYFKTPPIPDTRIMVNVDVVQLIDLLQGGRSTRSQPPRSTIGPDERRDR